MYSIKWKFKFSFRILKLFSFERTKASELKQKSEEQSLEYIGIELKMRKKSRTLFLNSLKFWKREIGDLWVLSNRRLLDVLHLN